jgi:hypothetical protein
VLEDSTAAGIVILTETYSVVNPTDCPASFVVFQRIIAGTNIFSIGPLTTITVQAEGPVVTYAYPALPHSLLASLGPTLEWVRSYCVPL